MQLWQVRFGVGADDPYYYNTVWVHGLSGPEAAALVKVVNAMGDLGNICFDGATMMGNVSKRPDLNWHTHTREDGTELRVSGHDVHVYPKDSP